MFSRVVSLLALCVALAASTSLRVDKAEFRKCHEWAKSQDEHTLEWKAEDLQKCCGKDLDAAKGLCGKIGINKPADPKFRQVCGVDSYTQSVCCGLAAYECQVKPTVKAAYEALSRPKKKLVVKPGNDNTHGPVGQ